MLAKCQSTRTSWNCTRQAPPRSLHSHKHPSSLGQRWAPRKASLTSYNVSSKKTCVNHTCLIAVASASKSGTSASTPSSRSSPTSPSNPVTKTHRMRLTNSSRRQCGRTASAYTSPTSSRMSTSSPKPVSTPITPSSFTG